MTQISVGENKCVAVVFVSLEIGLQFQLASSCSLTEVVEFLAGDCCIVEHSLANCSTMF